jgi:heparosan-N-sulfate-glucuronate 5-epimerase
VKRKIVIALVLIVLIIPVAYKVYKKIRYVKPLVQKDSLIFEFDSLGWDKCLNNEFVYDNFEINEVADSLLPYNKPFDCFYVEYSNDSLPLYKYESKLYRHPSVFFLYGLRNLNDYRKTKNDFYLNRCIRYNNEVMKLTTEVDTASLFQFPFDFALHGYKNQIMHAPWYSGFTQGMSILFNARLYKITKDKKYADNMLKSFNAYLLLKANASKNKNIWISCIDSNKNIWFEEYPQEYPGFTLNGKIFSILAMYECYMATHNETVKKYFLAGLTTIKKNVGRFRKVGDRSYYCLKHKVNFAPHYHKIHIEQLHILYLITKDHYFEVMSKNFISDSLKISDQ